MHPFFVDYLERLTTLHADIEQVLTGLPQVAIDWSPGPEMNSLAVLATHVAGSEIYWIGDILLRQATVRHRATEFETSAVTADTLKTRLAQALEDSRTAVAQLSLAMLAEERTAPGRADETYSVSWCLLHCLEHIATHVGHMQVTRQLWETMQHE